MGTVDRYPLVKSVRPLAGQRLRVEFDNGVTKVYDCTPLLGTEVFKPLADEAIFRSVRADEHGYAVIWNDAIDLAESELWLNGRIEAEIPDALVARDKPKTDN
jgi:hypothetical protein